MAQNISLLGADYPDVPAVQLPKTGGGTATFYDIEVVDNLNSQSATDALSANQGRVLNEKISPLTGNTKWADWTEITNYDAGQTWNGSYYTKIGKITFVQISVQGLTTNLMTKIFQLPIGYRPLFTIEFDGFGGLAYLNHAHIKIAATGDVSVYSADTYATGFIAFPSL